MLLIFHETRLSCKTELTSHSPHGTLVVPGEQYACVHTDVHAVVNYHRYIEASKVKTACYITYSGMENLQGVLEWMYVYVLSREGMLALAVIGVAGMAVNFARGLLVRQALARKRRSKYQATRQGINELEQRLAQAKVNL